MLPDNPTIAIGQQLQLQAVMLDMAGFVTSGRTPEWSTSNPGVAQVNGDGFVSAVAEGTADISATVDGLVAAAVVTVIAPTNVRVCSSSSGGIPTYGTLADGVAAVAAGASCVFALGFRR